MGSNESENSYMQLRKKMMIIWFTGVSLLLIYILYQSSTNSFLAQKTFSLWQWFAMATGPLTVLILFLYRERKRINNTKYNRLATYLPLGISIYILLCFSPVFLDPFFNERIEEMITFSYIYILPIQILLLLLIAAYFFSNAKPVELQETVIEPAVEAKEEDQLAVLVEVGKTFVINKNKNGLSNVCERLLALGGLDEALQIVQKYYRNTNQDHHPILELREELSAIKLDENNNEISKENAINKIALVKDSLINIISELKVNKAS